MEKTVTKTRKTLDGVIVSAKNTKTVVVLVSRLVKHPKYQKYLKQSKRYQVHHENLELHEGDRVRIEETRPISRHKHFVVINKLEH